MKTVIHAMEMNTQKNTTIMDNNLYELTLPDRISNTKTHNTSHGAPLKKRDNVKQCTPVFIRRQIVQISSSQTMAMQI
jgi:hypothetical protein